MKPVLLPKPRSAFSVRHCESAEYPEAFHVLPAESLAGALPQSKQFHASPFSTTFTYVTIGAPPVYARAVEFTAPPTRRGSVPSVV